MSKKLLILLVEDDAADAELVERELKKADLAFACEYIQTEADFVRALQGPPPDLILRIIRCRRSAARRHSDWRARNIPTSPSSAFPEPSARKSGGSHAAGGNGLCFEK